MNDNELNLDERPKTSASCNNCSLQIESLSRRLKALEECVMTLQSNEAMRVATSTIYTEQRVKLLENMILEYGKDLLQLEEKVQLLESFIRHLVD